MQVIRVSLKTGSLILAALFAALGSAAETAGSSAHLTPILDVHETQQNVGISSVLMHADQVASELHTGFANLETSTPVTASTRFQSMSITKAFVGAALIKTASLELVDLDAPITDYLPDYPSMHTTPFTLRMLAAHTSGIPHLRHPDRRNLYVQHFESAGAALQTFQDLPLSHPPGQSYTYSSSGYTLIAAVLEQVHGQPFPEILQTLIADPLELSDTQSGNVQKPMKNLARSYSFVDMWDYQPVPELQQIPTWDFSYNAGGGNLVTSAHDLAKFGSAFTRPGFFSQDELNLFYEPISPGQSTWSFGWFVNENDNGETYLSISGATPGVQAGLLVFPQYDLVVSALSNSWGKDSAGGALVLSAPLEALVAYKQSVRSNN